MRPKVMQRMLVSSLILTFKIALTMLIWISTMERARSCPEGFARLFGTAMGLLYAGTMTGVLFSLAVPAFGRPVVACAALATSAVLMVAVAPRSDSAPLVERSVSDAHEEACRRIAESFGLTAREAEILQLYTQGRSVPFICEKLFISKNTANTHIRHIREKTATHSKQELIDLVELHAPEDDAGAQK